MTFTSIIHRYVTVVIFRNDDIYSSRVMAVFFFPLD